MVIIRDEDSFSRRIIELDAGEKMDITFNDNPTPDISKTVPAEKRVVIIITYEIRNIMP